MGLNYFFFAGCSVVFVTVAFRKKRKSRSDQLFRGFKLYETIIITYKIPYHFGSINYLTVDLFEG